MRTILVGAVSALLASQGAYAASPSDRPLFTDPAAAQTCAGMGYAANPAAQPIFETCVRIITEAMLAKRSDRARYEKEFKVALAPLIAQYNQLAAAHNQQVAEAAQLQAQVDQQAAAQQQAYADQQAQAAAVQEQLRQARVQQNLQLMQLGASMMRGSAPSTTTHTFIVNGRMETCTTTGTVTNCN